MTIYKNIIEAEKEIKALKEEAKKIVFTNGCFDILHVGHVIYLEQAKALGDILVIGLNTDSSVKKIKGPKRPINPELDRATVLDALKMVDIVVFFNEDTPIDVIKKVKPDVHVKGGDYEATDLPEYPIVKEYGGEVVILPFVPGKSTTEIIKAIQNFSG